MTAASPVPKNTNDQLEAKDSFEVAAYTKDRYLELHKNKTNALQIYEKAVAEVTKEKRKLINEALHSQEKQSESDDHPTYLGLFNEKWAERAAPGSLEAWDSPVAYLANLYAFAQQIEGEKKDEDENENEKIKKRRSDLATLLVDNVAVEKEIPTLELVNDILSKSILSAIEDKEPVNLDEKLSTTHYPFSLPFHLPLNQITLGLRAAKTTLGTVIRQTNQQSAGSIIEAIGSDKARAALKAYGELSPEQQKILTDKSDAATYLPSNYGPKFFNVQVQEADKYKVDVAKFCKATGLQRSELDQILASSVYAATRSSKMGGASSTQLTANKVEAHEYGAIYLNQAEEKTAPTIFSDQLVGAPAAFIRLNRLIRLQRWLALPYDQLDWLITALAYASNSRDMVEAFSDSMLRGLGLFHHLQREYGLQADEFAALIDQISPYARDGATSLLDRIFCATGTGASIQIDDQFFKVEPQYSQITRPLCADLGVSEATLAELAKFSDFPLHCSLTCISMFYRLVKIPRLFGLTVKEGLMLLRLMGGGQDTYIKYLVAAHIKEPGDKEIDILDVILALESAVHWLKAHKLSVAQVWTWCSKSIPPMNKVALLERLSPLKQAIQPCLLNEDSFACIELPSTINAANKSTTWLKILENFVDKKGIVVAHKALSYLIEWDDKNSLFQKKKLELKKLEEKEFIDFKIEFNALCSKEYEKLNLAYEEINNIIEEKFKNPDLFDDYERIIFKELKRILKSIEDRGKDFDELPIRLFENNFLDKICKNQSNNISEKFGILSEKCISEGWNSFYDEAKKDHPNLSLLDTIDKNPIYDFLEKFNLFLQKAGSLKNEVTNISTLQSNLIKELTQEGVDSKNIFFKKISLSAHTQLLQTLSQAQAAQLNAIARVLSQLYDLPLESLRAILQWHHFDWQQFVSMTLNLEENAPDKIPDAYLQLVYALDRHVDLIKKLKLSAAALESLLTKTEWSDHVELTFQDIYRLSCYADFLSSNAKDETQALDYLRHFNAKNQIHTDDTYALLADLLNWEKLEVKTALEKFDKHGNSPLDHLDWLMRLHALSRQTGLSAAALLEAADLDEKKAFSKWQAVGQVVISAAARGVATRQT